LKKTKADINGLAAKNGGVIAYRIEIHSFGERDFETPGAHIYDQRFEFNGDRLVPTVIGSPYKPTEAFKL